MACYPRSSSLSCKNLIHQLATLQGGPTSLVLFCGSEGLSIRSNMQLLMINSQFGSQIGSQKRGQSIMDFKPWAKARRSMYSIVEPNGEARHQRLGDSSTTRKGVEEQLGHDTQDVASINVSRLLEQRTPLHEASSSLALTPMHPFGLRFAQLSPIDQAFFLLGFIACSITGALSALLLTAIPTLNSMRRAAIAVEKLADVAREELPPTMAAIRLSGMEISDLTLELNDLSHEIYDGVRSSSRSVHAAEVGLRRIGSVAASQTFAMLQEQAKYPVAAVKPAFLGAAATTRQAVEHARNAVIQLATHPTVTGWLGRGKKQENTDASETDQALAAEVPVEEILDKIVEELSSMDDNETDGDKPIAVPVTGK